MAEPILGSPLSTIGYVLLLLIILSGGLCWYFNINPATFISEKLRGLQEEKAPEARPGDVDNKTQEPASQNNQGQGATAIPQGTGALAPVWQIGSSCATELAETLTSGRKTTRTPGNRSAS